MKVLAGFWILLLHLLLSCCSSPPKPKSAMSKVTVKVPAMTEARRVIAGSLAVVGTDISLGDITIVCEPSGDSALFSTCNGTVQESLLLAYLENGPYNGSVVLLHPKDAPTYIRGENDDLLWVFVDDAVSAGDMVSFLTGMRNKLYRVDNIQKYYENLADRSDSDKH